MSLMSALDHINILIGGSSGSVNTRGIHCSVELLQEAIGDVLKVLSGALERLSGCGLVWVKLCTVLLTLGLDTDVHLGLSRVRDSVTGKIDILAA